jgi:hypothetical protein
VGQLERLNGLRESEKFWPIGGARLLATDLTELERQYVHKRIAEELKLAKAQNEHTISMRVKMATSAAKARSSRSSRLDTHTRSIQAHLRAAQS